MHSLSSSTPSSLLLLLLQESRLPAMQTQYKLMDWMFAPLYLFGTVRRRTRARREEEEEELFVFNEWNTNKLLLYYGRTRARPFRMQNY